MGLILTYMGLIPADLRLTLTYVGLIQTWIGLMNYMGLILTYMGLVRDAAGRHGSGRVSKFQNATGGAGSRVSHKFSYGSRVKGISGAG